MNKFVRLLSFILVVQLLLFVFVQINNQVPEFEGDSDAPITEVDADEIVAIKLFDKKDRSTPLTIERSSEGLWVLPAEQFFPASNKKIGQLFDTLFQSKRGYPVGQTQIAARSFSLTEDTYEKKIVLTARDGQQHTLFLGSSPGPRYLYVRIDNEDQSYSLSYALADISDSSSQWIDKDFLKIDEDSINSISFKDVYLAKREGVFKLDEDLKDNEIFRLETVEELFKALGNLSVIEVLPNDVVSDETDVLSIEVGTTDEKNYSLLFYPLGEEAAGYAVQKTGQPFYVKISTTAYKALSVFNRDSFIEMKKIEQESEIAAQPTAMN